MKLVERLELGSQALKNLDGDRLSPIDETIPELELTPPRGDPLDAISFDLEGWRLSDELIGAGASLGAQGHLGAEGEKDARRIDRELWIGDDCEEELLSLPCLHIAHFDGV